jgi:hypothetical protein
MDQTWRETFPNYDWYNIQQDDFEEHAKIALHRKYGKTVEFGCNYCAQQALLNDDVGNWSDDGITYSIIDEPPWEYTYDEVREKWNNATGQSYKNHK